jgi:SAM-dependent methyltransferase
MSQPLQTQSSQGWDEFWRRTTLSADDDARLILAESRSVRWRRLERLLERHGVRWQGLKTLELGSGRGQASLILALKGAQATLLDSSPQALESARRLFGHFGCQATYVEADILTGLAPFHQQFDLALSFGLAEHFRYPQRQQIITLHGSVVKPGGWVVIEVPNAYCLPYQWFKWLAQRTGHWKVGLEIPFTAGELIRCARAARLFPVQVISSSAIRDTLDLLCFQILEHLSGDRLKIDRRPFEVPTPCDRYAGYSLTLAAKSPQAEEG